MQPPPMGGPLMDFAQAPSGAAGMAAAGMTAQHAVTVLCMLPARTLRKALLRGGAGMREGEWWAGRADVLLGTGTGLHGLQPLLQAATAGTQSTLTHTMHNTMPPFPPPTHAPSPLPAATKPFTPATHPQACWRARRPPPSLPRWRAGEKRARLLGACWGRCWWHRRGRGGGEGEGELEREGWGEEGGRGGVFDRPCLTSLWGLLPVPVQLCVGRL